MALKIAGFDVLTVPSISPNDDRAGHYDPFNTSTRTIQKGYRKTERHAAFLADTILEKDFPVPMRDGVKLYCDIFRPTGSQKVPAILMWSPYGKSGNGPHGLDMIEGRFGVPQERLSGYEKFEGLDPAEWVAKGFAIVNFDLRGSWDSEGIVPWLGSQDGRDGYDAIEYIHKLDWCTGKVALAGNSWLAMSQWYIAAENPPHLTCFAPWEAASDFYRDTLCRGGVPYPYDLMWNLLETTMIGRGQAESALGMLNKYPLYNEYWEDKRAKLDKIKVPAYVLASYSSALHTTGSIRGYNELGSSEKWLRFHPRQEWSDLYSQAGTDDLQKFFDYYLKGVENDWTKTPSIRLAVLPFNKDPIENVAIKAYPLPETAYTKLYLTEKGVLDKTPAAKSSTDSYQADYAAKNDDNDSEELSFQYKFPQPTWLAGYSKAILHMSCDSSDDLDVFVQLRKLDKSGKVLQCMNVPLGKLIPPKSSASEVDNSCFLKYLGPTGVLRASHAVTKKPNSDENAWPEYTNESRTPIKPGTIVRLEVPIWPTGIAFDEGESLAIKISGHYMSFLEFGFLNGKSKIENKGRHVLHFGGEHDSHIVVPLCDPL